MAGSARLTGRTRTKVEEMLPQVGRVLDELGVRYWLDGGTLLGVIREGRLLPWDNDCDVFLDNPSEQQIGCLISLLKKRGLRVRVRKSHGWMGPFSKGSNRLIKVRNYRWGILSGPALIDLFMVRTEGEESYWALSETLSSCSNQYFASLRRVAFLGYDFPVPALTEEYLSFRYGVDWRTPRLDWDSSQDDGALRTKR